MMENLGAIAEFDTEIGGEVLAVRGDRLVLTRTEYQTPGGFESVTLDVVGIDREGLAECFVTFDEDQLDAVFDELDERWIAGEGAEHEYLIRRLGDFRAAYADRDWAAIEMIVAEDFVFVDHRPMGLPENSRAGYVRVMQESVEQTPDMRMVLRSASIRGDVVLARTHRVGDTPEGFSYDWEQFAVQQFAAGLLHRVELFPIEREAEARARFEELAREPRTPYVDNRLVRFVTRNGWLSARGVLIDPGYAEDCVLVDHRPAVNAGELVGGADVARSIQSGVEVFGELRVEPIAVRGDRLALYRWAFVQDGGFEAPGICVMEMDADNRICAITSFQESHAASAVDLLEARHRELSGAAYTTVEAGFVAAQAAFNRRDWDAFAETMVPEAQALDHAPLGWGTIDREAYVTFIRALIDQVPTAVLAFSKVLVQGDAALTVMPMDGVTAEGSAYRWSKVVVGRVEGSGRFTEFAYFDIEQWDEALALFDDWSGVNDDAAASAEPLSNLVMRQDELQMARFTAGDASGALALVSDSYTMVDHRFAGITPAAVGREAFLDQVRAYAAAGLGHIETRNIAVLGDRLALAWQTLGSDDGFDTVSIKLGEVDEDGRFSRTEIFAEDDLPAALTTLNEWYIEGEGAEHEEAIRRYLDFAWAYREQNWSALEALFSTDAVLADHRLIGQGWQTPTDFLASTRTVVDLVPDVTHIPRRVEVRGSTTLVDGEALGTTSEGSTYTWGYLMVTHWTAGLIRRLEMFDVADAASARARFGELAVDRPTPTVDNAAVRVNERFGWLAGHGRVEEARTLLAPDLLAIDRRPGVAAPDMVGPDARLENLAAVVEVFGGIDTTYVAVRGERLMLLAWTISTGDAFAVSGYDVTEIDDSGRICRIVTFAEDQLAEAMRELDARYDEIRTELLGPHERTPDPDNAAVRLLMQTSRLIWTDLDAALDHFAPNAFGLARESGPSLGLSAENHAMWHDVLSSLAATYDDVRYEPLAVRGEFLALLRQEFIADGYVTPTLLLVELTDDELIARLDTFAEADLAGAMTALDARFDERAIAPSDATILDVAVLAERAKSDLDIDNAVVERLREGRELLAAGDASFAEFFAEDVVAEDRRVVVSMPVSRGSARARRADHGGRVRVRRDRPRPGGRAGRPPRAGSPNVVTRWVRDGRPRALGVRRRSDGAARGDLRRDRSDRGAHRTRCPPYAARCAHAN